MSHLSLGLYDSSIGMSSSLMRLRRYLVLLFELSCTNFNPSAAAYSSISPLPISINGLMYLPLFGGMPPKPASPAPFKSRIIIVSAWSSILCPVAILCALYLPAVSSKNLSLASRAASCKDSPFFARDRTLTFSDTNLTPIFLASLFTNASSLSDSFPLKE